MYRKFVPRLNKFAFLPFLSLESHATTSKNFISCFKMCDFSRYSSENRVSSKWSVLILVSVLRACVCVRVWVCVFSEKNCVYLVVLIYTLILNKFVISYSFNCSRFIWRSLSDIIPPSKFSTCSLLMLVEFCVASCIISIGCVSTYRLLSAEPPTTLLEQDLPSCLEDRCYSPPSFHCATRNSQRICFHSARTL